MSTLLTYAQQKALVAQKLAVEKIDGDLSVFKYHRRVMYDYLWDKHPELLECRGHVYNNKTGELIQAAPTKSFNYLENGHWKYVSLDQMVIMHKKINGFMACATLYNGELLVSTTGSTTSEYAKWAKEEITKSVPMQYFDKETTELFEIVVPQDPHIVTEVTGAHHLGFRLKDNGYFIPRASRYKAKEMTLGDALEFVKSDRGEGYMMYPLNDSGEVITNHCCKLKTPYYVGKKKLMRMTDTNVERMYANPSASSASLPEMWRDIPFAVVESFTEETWKSMSEQDRRAELEKLLE